MGGLSDNPFGKWKPSKKVLFIVLLAVLGLLVMAKLATHGRAVNTQTGSTKATESEATKGTDEVITEVETEASTGAEKPTQEEIGLSDEVIKQLQEKQREEGVTPGDNAKAWEAGVKESIQATEGVQESTQQASTGETSSNIEQGQETQSGGPEDKSNGRNFTTKDPKKPTMNSDGELEKSVADKVKDSMQPGSGPVVLENSSETMKVGYTIKDYYESSSGKGAVGDTLLLGKIGVKVAPRLSEKGYTVKTSKDTATLNFADIGLVVITKVEDFDVTGLSLKQVGVLGGFGSISELDSQKPTGGALTAYSYMAVSSDNQVAIQYYKCPFGTYQFYYTSIGAPIGLATMLGLNVTPDESINSVENVQ